MSTYPLSTGEAVQAVLEGRECESEYGRRMRLQSSEPRVFWDQKDFAVCTAHLSVRWRLVQHPLAPVLVKREEALRALAEGKTIRRKTGRYYAVLDTGKLMGRLAQTGQGWKPTTIAFVEELLDDSACWEVLP